MPKFYITTAIVYANSYPHIGHAYELVTTDVGARYRRLKGDEVFFATGSDEHSVNVLAKAKEQGKDPIKYCDEMAGIYSALWKKYNISYDGYIRTTGEKHKKTVGEIFKKIQEKGDIYKGEYEGWYCRSCEAFFVESDLDEEGNCPVHRSKPERVKEENYFLKLSKYAGRLLKHIESNPDFIRPESRKNEITGILKSGLRDISVTRAGKGWGIPMPGDSTQTVYVWFDALINYISALDYNGGEGELYKKFWPADVHVIGKDIVKFHCIIWPVMLMSAGIALPKKIFGHGFLLNKGEKMSKTRGNIVEPGNLAAQFGVDAIRYFFCSHITNGADGEYSEEAIITRFNNDLANDFGNLINRTLNMAEKYFEGKVPEPGEKAAQGAEKQMEEKIKGLYAGYCGMMDSLDYSGAMAGVWDVIKAANKYIEDAAPWSLNKKGETELLGRVMYNLLEAIRVASAAVAPVMPETAVKIWKKLGLDYKMEDIRLDKEMMFGVLKPGTAVKKGGPLFPRIKDEKKSK